MKVLIANRGAIARRIVRSCVAKGLSTVVVYSDADEGAPYLAEASEAYRLEGVHAQDTYLAQDKLLAIAQASGADAVHPGYGFLAENDEFAQRVIDAGLLFIGPRPRWLAEMGDKVAARKLATAHGYPTFAGSKLLRDEAAALAAARSIGYPVMLKPSGGGGGIGMRIVNSPEEMGVALSQAQATAAGAFGDDAVYLEKCIRNPRHIEYQVVGDGHGQAIHLYERECSIQRRNQKLIEETPAPGLSRQELEEQAVQSAAFCAQLGYDSVGTIETLRTPDGASGFLEMNTRIQVEHGVTEAVTGIDLVGLQIDLACGERLPKTPPREGYAMEVRLYAEDSQQMLPSTGRLHVYRPPSHTGLRVDTGYAEGQIVSPYYDPLLAKLIATGTTREMAIGRLVVALRAFEIQGVQTNASLLTRVLESERFLSGQIDTELLPDLLTN